MHSLPVHWLPRAFVRVLTKNLLTSVATIVDLSPYSTFPFFTGTLMLKAIPRSALMTRILLKYITVSPAGPKLLADIVAVLFRQPSLLTATSCE